MAQVELGGNGPAVSAVSSGPAAAAISTGPPTYRILIDGDRVSYQHETTLSGARTPTPKDCRPASGEEVREVLGRVATRTPVWRGFLVIILVIAGGFALAAFFGWGADLFKPSPHPDARSRAEVLRERAAARRPPTIPPAGWSGGAALAFLILGIPLTIFAHRRDLRLGRILLTYEADPSTDRLYRQFREAFAEFAGSAGLWHVTEERAADSRLHAGATVLVDQRGISAGLGLPRGVQCNMEVPILFAPGKTLYFFPDRLLLYTSLGVSATSYGDLKAGAKRIGFRTTGSVPQDARVIGTTWRYVTVAGGPDRRFRNNPEIPIVEYGELQLTTPSGLDDMFQCSNAAAAAPLASALSALARRPQESPPSVRIGPAPETPSTGGESDKPRKESPRKRSVEELIGDLNSLIGLESVKNDVQELVAFLQVQQLRKTKALPSAPLSLHLIFYGNPGTGKTTVARLIAQLYRALNILSKGHLVETDRSGLVAGYLGQTALKVQEVVKEALGGVLFVDEAYALVPEHGSDSYGEEAIATLLKAMEDHRDDLAVILAGYPDKMERLLSSNPGLQSRFNKYLRFTDYNPDQLLSIFDRFCQQSGYQMGTGARARLEGMLKAAYDRRDERFGNARLARNLFEKAIVNQAARIVTSKDQSVEVLSVIEATDLEEAKEGL